MPIDCEQLLPAVVRIAQAAGARILQYYQQDNMEVTYKADESPVTRADKEAHDLIVDALEKLDHTIPILSEESPDIPWDIRKYWSRYWLCDPLDGTRDFVRGEPEFTVNIALIQNHQPILGVIYAPVFNHLYYAAKNHGAYRKIGNAASELILYQHHEKPWGRRAVGSSFEDDVHTNHFLQQLKPCTWVVMSSSLKFCRIAEGDYDFYPRFVPSMEWDTAAGQCIVEAAGGRVVTMFGDTLAYNKKESLENPAFVAYADRHHQFR